MSGYFNLGDISARNYFLVTSSCLGLLLAWISRDGSNAPLLQLLVVWQANALLSIAIVISVHILLLKHTHISNVNRWLQLVLSGIVGSTLFSPIALLIDLVLMNEPIPADLASEWLDEYGGVVPSVTFAWIAMNAPWLMGYRFEKQPTVTKPNEAASEKGSADPHNNQHPHKPVSKLQALYQVLPSGIGKEIIYMKAELHYIKVTTCQGEALVLFNLKDAASLFTPADGYLCHRSYWVAKNHICDFQKVGRGGELTLSNNAKIPVSKRKLADFSAWLAIKHDDAIAVMDAKTA